MIDLTHPQRLIVEAEFAEPPAARFVSAYQAAQQIAVAVVAAAPRRARGRTDVWPLLAAAAPELAEWAAYFAAYAPAAQVGTVSERVAADMVRAAGQFLAEAARWLRRRERAVAAEAI